jgi:antitoxin HicB
MKFPVVLTADLEDGGFVVHFPDIPGAFTQGETREESLKWAQEALETAIECHFELKKAIPKPSKPAPGQDVIELPASLAAKILLLNEMLAQNVRPAELARRLNTSPQEVTRLTDLRHKTRIDGIQSALRALGKNLELRLA